MRKLLSCLGRDVVMLFLFGGMIVGMSVGDAFVSFKPAVSFEDMLDGEEVRAGTHVAGNVVYALDYFASESSYTRYRDGSRSGSKKSGNYYMIPTASGYIGLKSRQVDVSALNALSEETFEYLTSGTEPSTEIFMQGSVEVMEEELTGYFREYLEEMGYTEAEIEDMGQPLVVQYVSFAAVRIMFAIGLVLIFLGGFIIWKRYKRLDDPNRGVMRVDDLPDTAAGQAP